jgi:hypothetical protein
MMPTRVLLSRLATAPLAAAVLACSDGVPTTRTRPTPTPCAVTVASSAPARASARAGDWWAEGQMPPTLRLTPDAGAVRGDLAFSGVARPGGVGTVLDGCLRLRFPALDVAGRPLLLEGALSSPTRLRIALRDSGSTEAPREFVLVKQ